MFLACIKRACIALHCMTAGSYQTLSEELPYLRVICIIPHQRAGGFHGLSTTRLLEAHRVPATRWLQNKVHPCMDQPDNKFPLPLVGAGQCHADPTFANKQLVFCRAYDRALSSSDKRL